MDASSLGVAAIVGAKVAVVTGEQRFTRLAGAVQAGVPQCAAVPIVAIGGVDLVRAACDRIASIVGTGVPVVAVGGARAHTEAVLAGGCVRAGVSIVAIVDVQEEDAVTS
jgi:hypothetical protein